MALLLFMDTCAAEALIGMAEDGAWIAFKILPDARRLGEILHTEASALLENSGKSWAQLDAVAVVSGPGSYTGLRIGMAAAKGWCFALDIPLLTLNRLSVLLEQSRQAQPFSGNTLLLLPARTGEWFALGADAAGTPLFAPVHMTEADFGAAQDRWDFRKIILAGEAGQQPASVAAEAVSFIRNEIQQHHLDAFLEARFRKGAFADLIQANPEYLKSVYINT